MVRQIVATSSDDQKQPTAKVNTEMTWLESRMTAICHRMHAAYIDNLDGKIGRNFWERKMGNGDLKSSR